MQPQSHWMIWFGEPRTYRCWLDVRNVTEQINVVMVTRILSLGRKDRGGLRYIQRYEAARPNQARCLCLMVRFVTLESTSIVFRKLRYSEGILIGHRDRVALYRESLDSLAIQVQSISRNVKFAFTGHRKEYHNDELNRWKFSLTFFLWNSND